MVPSALNASFVGDGQLIDIPKFNILTLDMLGSHDLDVPQGKDGDVGRGVALGNIQVPEIRERRHRRSSVHVSVHVCVWCV